jgi:hypothetical protein
MPKTEVRLVSIGKGGTNEALRTYCWLIVKVLFSLLKFAVAG